jgi:hypothetical protein
MNKAGALTQENVCVARDMYQTDRRRHLYLQTKNFFVLQSPGEFILSHVLKHFHATHEVYRVKPLMFCPGFSPCLKK